MFKVFVNDGTEKLPSDDICYIIGKKGIFLKKKVGLMESVAQVENISILDDIETSARIHIPKIPGELFAKVYQFTKKIYKLHNSESVVLLYYNDEKKDFKLLIPNQEVSGTSIEYDKIQHLDTYNLIGTIHSHAGFSAFHSSTDDKDEKHFDGIHITIGGLKRKIFEVSCSVVSNGNRFINDPMDYIDGIHSTSKEDSLLTNKNYILDESLENIEFDISWLKNVTKKTYKVSDYYRNLGKYQTVNNMKYPIGFNDFDFNFNFDDKDFKHDFDDEDFNPCVDCPFKNYKLEMQEEEEIIKMLEEDIIEDNLEELSDSKGGYIGY